MPQYAPSHAYLSAHPDDNGKAFLSDTDGFLPPFPLPALPAPFSKWHTLARQLPDLYESGEWDQFITSLPDENNFPLDFLSDQHLLRANLALGSIAHAIFHVAKKPIPPCVSIPWKKVSERLGRSIPCLASIDFLVYNPEALSKYEGMKIDSPFTQMRPSITMTALKAEHNYVLKGYSIEHAARPLPKLITIAQNAVVNADDGQLRDTLIEMIDVLENMTKAFTKPDSRPLNKFSMDTVDWSRSIDISASPVEKGEKGGSGLLFPSIHLLDAFFCRRKYESELGKLATHEKSWLPKIHQEFFSKVLETSTMDYVLSNKNKALLILFRRAVLAFGGESGFLGKHRIRLTGYLEIMFKIGRAATGNGMGQSVSWDRRIWRIINRSMKNSMKERVGLREDWYTEATIKEVSAIPGGDAFRVLIDGHGAFHYKPGDLLGILPENRDPLVQDVLHLLKAKPDSKVLVTDPHWVRLLARRGLHVEKEKEVELTMIDFLRYAKLQPLDRQLGSRLAQAMSVTDPSVVALLQAEEATNVKGALELLKHVGVSSTEKLLSRLDAIFEPLTPRYYSIASHIRVEPNVVEIVVGRVQYSAKSLIAHHSSLSVSGKHLLDSCKNFASDVSSHSSAEEGSRKRENDASHREQAAKRRRISEGVHTVEASSASQDEAEADTATAVHSPSSLESFQSSDDRILDTLKGISSSYLKTLSPGHRVTARIVPTLDFHLPQDPSVPIIMIAQGTGFAPFRPFLKQLALQKRDGTPRRKSWLILGVKSRDKIPFISDIEEAVCKHKVADLSLAISREDFELDSTTTQDSDHLQFCSAPRKHVADLFTSSHSELHKLWQLVTGEGAHIFVCGKPELELMTRHALAAGARQFGANNEHEVDATKFADSLSANKRLHADCYDSGQPDQLVKTYSRAEVAEHRTSNDCWVTFRDGVYDISQYLQVHPGGPKLLLEKGGQDITADFETSHGADNYRVASMLHAYKIGHLEGFEQADERAKRFMREWSEPLLATVMERRGVFELDWNQFDDIDVGGDAGERTAKTGRYTKHDEAESALKKVVTCYEPQMFELLKDYLGEKLTKHVPKRETDAESLLKKLDAIRSEAMRFDAEVGAGWDRARTHGMLKRCAAMMEQFIQTAVQLQRVAERAARRSAGGSGDARDGVGAMAAEVARRAVDGVTAVYAPMRGGC
ncbi:NADPH-cytochrome p450 reductase [Gracilaria domingensis]|nr:NADPH-cytochrome p450 reductase [Gracilaria domingensis]